MKAAIMPMRVFVGSNRVLDGRIERSRWTAGFFNHHMS